MKRSLLTGMVLMLCLFSAGAQNKDQVQVYYVHNTGRCATCKAVESVTQEVVKTYKQEEVSFFAINREEETDHPIIQKFKVTGQKLLLVKGEKMVDLTNDAFLNARTKPEKLKEILNKNLKKLI